MPAGEKRSLSPARRDVLALLSQGRQQHSRAAPGVNPLSPHRGWLTEAPGVPTLNCPAWAACWVLHCGPCRGA
jgi:hypothetical protein